MSDFIISEDQKNTTQILKWQARYAHSLSQVRNQVSLPSVV